MYYYYYYYNPHKITIILSSMTSPEDYARESPYFKRNHVGKVTCTLCHIYCNDERNFIKHLAGKTHRMSLERIEAAERRKRRLVDDEKRNEEAYQRRQEELAAQQLLSMKQNPQSSSSTATSTTSGNAAAAALQLVGPHGVPRYEFRTEHDSVQFVTKIWLEFFFPHAQDGTRPVHRWVSSHEQQMEKPANAEDRNYFIYLLIACEGYTTAALKFPVDAKRTTEEEEKWREKEREKKRLAHGNLWQQGTSGSTTSHLQEAENGGGGDDSAPLYRSAWNPMRRQYSIFFEMYR